MMNVESYRQYAADCVRQAQDEESADDKNILLNVALAWLRLAQQTETKPIDETDEIAETGEATPAEPAPRELAS